jgi:hypothetical protein
VVWGRIGELFVALCLMYIAFVNRQVAPAWAWSAVALFAVLTAVIVWVEALIERREAVVRYYQQGLARIEERWQDGAPTGERFADPAHPYAEDLDLFGAGGLYGLVCVARTAVGQETLARWLKQPAGAAEARARQAAVREIVPRIDLRQSLWEAGSLLESEVARAPLLAWIEAPPGGATPARRWTAAALGAGGVLAFWLLVTGRVVPAGAIFLVQAIFASRLRVLTAEISEAGARRARELKTVARLVGLLEGETFASPMLTAMRQELAGQGQGEAGLTSRRRLRGLIRLVDLLDTRRNALVALVTAPLLMGTQLALAIEAWRSRNRPVLAHWLEVVGTIEALASLATYAFEHPDDQFPEILDEEAGPRYLGEALAHPLLPRATRKANDLALGESGLNILIVTGSNMSGKTTLLRTTGINAVLALAGAPVCARRLRLAPLAVAASLRTRESLQAGVSRFFGEIRRLRTIVELAERSPRTLFLIDEMLHGTNSHDRQRGGEAVLRQLATAGCIGLITTHDLALAQLGELPELHAANAHFQDRIEDDRLIFDYQMRPGIASRSNALDLMRLVGLRV